jgi:hypothetical protein
MNSWYPGTGLGMGFYPRPVLERDYLRLRDRRLGTARCSRCAAQPHTAIEACGRVIEASSNLVGRNATAAASPTSCASASRTPNSEASTRHGHSCASVRTSLQPGHVRGSPRRNRRPPFRQAHGMKVPSGCFQDDCGPTVVAKAFQTARRCPATHEDRRAAVKKRSHTLHAALQPLAGCRKPRVVAAPPRCSLAPFSRRKLFPGAQKNTTLDGRCAAGSAKPLTCPLFGTLARHC